MATKSKSPTQKSAGTNSLDRFFKEGIAIISNYMIHGIDGSVSFIRIIDDIRASSFPVMFGRLCISAEFYRQPGITLQDLQSANIKFILDLVNPQGETFELGDFQADFSKQPEHQNQVHKHRFMADIAQLFSINHYGDYRFRLVAALENGETKVLSQNIVQVLGPIQQPV